MAEKAVRVRPPAAMWAASLILLTGCGAPMAPYVLAVGEQHPDWRLEAKITTVEVCYNRLTTTPEAVKQLAEDVCVEQDAHAEFVRHDNLRCSLVQPVSAIFVCRGDRDGAATGSGSRGSVEDR